MPAFLTHWRILIETARHSADAGSDLGSLIIDAAALRRRAHGWATPPETTPAGAVWDTGPLPEINYNFPGSDISALAFLGALSPDIVYYHKDHFRDTLRDAHLHKQHLLTRPDDKHLCWANLLHSNRSGDVLIAFLEQVALVPAPALRSQALAFALGYVSHIATDIALNPWINALASTNPRRGSPGSHFYVELHMDEYLADTYYRYPRYRYRGTRQPWGQYIEPAAEYFTRPDTLATQILHLFASAAEITYGLQEEQTAAFKRDFIKGLEQLRHFLAGRGRFRRLTLKAALRSQKQDPVAGTIARRETSLPGTLTFEQVLGYATRLSEHLCRLAIRYYAALRNTRATASERSSRRAALIDDLRNWNLDTGYYMDVRMGEEITLHLLHNWVHFTDLWERAAEDISFGQSAIDQVHPGR